jgi:hypothetical protein
VWHYAGGFPAGSPESRSAPRVQTGFRIQPWKGSSQRRPSNEDLCNRSRVDLRFRPRSPGTCSARPMAIGSEGNHHSSRDPSRHSSRDFSSRLEPGGLDGLWPGRAAPCRFHPDAVSSIS